MNPKDIVVMPLGVGMEARVARKHICNQEKRPEYCRANDCHLKRWVSYVDDKGVKAEGECQGPEHNRW